MSNHHSLLHRLLFNPTYAAGLDIQDHQLQLAHVQPGKNTLTATHEHPLPAGIIENGEIRDERELARNLADALRASGIKNTYYVTHPPAQHTAMRLLTFPAMPAKELKSAVRYEASRNLPYALADAAISFSPIEQGKPKGGKAKKPRRGKNTKQDDAPKAAEAQAPDQDSKKERGGSVRGKQPRSFLVAATPNAHVLTLMRVAKTAGIRLGVIEPRPLATLRALKHHGLITSDEMILDVGAKHSNLTVITGGAVALARTLPYGASDLADGAPHAADGFNRDITLTIEYVTRISDTLQLRRLVITGGELHATLTTAVEGLNLEVTTAATPDKIPATGLPAYGMALRGARGV